MVGGVRPSLCGAGRCGETGWKVWGRRGVRDSSRLDARSRGRDSYLLTSINLRGLRPVFECSFSCKRYPPRARSPPAFLLPPECQHSRAAGESNVSAPLPLTHPEARERFQTSHVIAPESRRNGLADQPARCARWSAHTHTTYSLARSRSLSLSLSLSLSRRPDHPARRTRCETLNPKP